MITIGIDPHKSSLTAVALQPSGEIAATIRLEVTSDTVARLRAWAIRWTHASGRSKARPDSVAAWPKACWRRPIGRGCARPAGRPGPAAQHRPCP
jgi:hypothetical protein